MTTRRTSQHGKSGEPRRETLLTDYAIVPLSAAERRRAALAVCHRSANVEEARELLSALGLLDAALLGAA
jgi:hypothetical protein